MQEYLLYLLFYTTVLNESSKSEIEGDLTYHEGRSLCIVSTYDNDI